MVKGFSLSENREIKAKKIEAILKDFLKKDITGYKILDVGCGNGIMIGYFGKQNNIYGVDIENKLEKGSEGISFYQIKSEKLPFGDKEFDVVISNHVIEHVNNQHLHLSEIQRVLKDDGVFYFATPNRNFPIEPHYRIPLIHYLGDVPFHRLLKIMRRYKEDIKLLSHKKQKKMLFNYFGYGKEYTGEVIKNFDKYYFNKIPIISEMELRMINSMALFSQTNIFMCKKNKMERY